MTFLLFFGKEGIFFLGGRGTGGRGTGGGGGDSSLPPDKPLLLRFPSPDKTLPERLSFVSSATNRYFSSVRAVLQGACHMVALQISSEPLVRQALRQVFQSRAVLSVKPTKKGKKV